MARHLLEIEDDYNFLLIGISCHMKDYRLSWAVNKKLGIELKKVEDLEVAGAKGSGSKLYSLYHYENNENYSNLFLVSNRGSSGLLISEEKQADYFFLIKGPEQAREQDIIIKRLKEVSFINTAYEINPYTLRSKKNLVF